MKKKTIIKTKEGMKVIIFRNLLAGNETEKVETEFLKMKN